MDYYLNKSSKHNSDFNFIDSNIIEKVSRQEFKNSDYELIDKSYGL